MLERNDVDADRYQDEIAYSHSDIIEASERADERAISILKIKEDSNCFWDGVVASADEWNDISIPRTKGVIKSFEQMTPAEIERFVKTSLRFHESLEYFVKTHCEVMEGL